jgi:hypothetical protein
MWGVHDRQLLLRRALNATLARTAADSRIYWLRIYCLKKLKK